jgi:hypothetical protein
VRTGWLLIAGALGCLAACTPEPFYAYDLSLLNRTHASPALALYRAAPLQDCAALAAGDLGSLATAAFAVESCVAVAPGGRVPLGSIVVGDSPPADAGGGGPACQAVVVRAAGLTDTVLTWQTVDTRISSREAFSEGATLYLEEAGDRLRLYIAGSSFVDAAPAAFTVPASGCAGLP